MILKATVADIPAIQELAQLTWRTCYPAFLSSAQIDYMLDWMYSTEQIANEMTVKDVTYLLAKDGEVPIAYAAYSRFKPGIWKIHKLYVHPAHQKQGIATTLLNHISQTGSSAGITKLILTVNKQNHLAIRAYEKNGFVIESSVVVDIGNGFQMDDYVMAKGLP